jgi:flagellar motor switch protein FliN
MSSSPSSLSSSDAAAPALPGPMAWLVDVPCRVEFVLGTCQVKVRDCLQFERDTVVPLDQPAGTDLELRAEGVRLATGEVVVVDDRAGLRINQILPPVAEEAA